MSDDNRIRTGLWKNEPGKPAGYSGKVEIDGQTFYVNLYKNERKETDRHPDLNLVLKPKDAGIRQAPERKPAPDPFDDSDSIPF